MSVSRIRKLSLALAALLGAGLVLPGPAAAQFSDSYKFLEAVRKKEGEKATDMLNEKGSSLINTRDVTSGDSALHIVTQRRDLTWMQFLVAKGANVNSRNVKGETPLVVAANLNFLEGVEFLVGQGAKVDEPNSTGETPLITAVHNRNIPMLRVLLRAGASPDRADNSGRSARDYARLDTKSDAVLKELEASTKPKLKIGPDVKVFGPKP
ncbi:MAG: ankyrin repeat domain-containing protein [Sphingomonadaceae bacterium]